METPQKYQDAINAIHEAVKCSNPSSWFPKVTDYEEHDAHKITSFEIDGKILKSSVSGAPFKNTELYKASSNAMLHMLNNPSRQCTIFACPISEVIRENTWIGESLVDIVVGFASLKNGMLSITPAWDDGRIYPMIGIKTPHRFNVPNVPNNVPNNVPELLHTTGYIVCACLMRLHRHSVSLHEYKTIKDLCEATPILGNVVRACGIKDYD
jgi:hypothetical protein